jgi:hypothetical protein
VSWVYKDEVGDLTSHDISTATLIVLLALERVKGIEPS